MSLGIGAIKVGRCTMKIQGRAGRFPWPPCEQGPVQQGTIKQYLPNTDLTLARLLRWVGRAQNLQFNQLRVICHDQHLSLTKIAGNTIENKLLFSLCNEWLRETSADLNVTQIHVCDCFDKSQYVLHQTNKPVEWWFASTKLIMILFLNANYYY